MENLPSCPDDASADQVFAHYIELRSTMLSLFKKDPVTFLDQIDLLFASDEECMANQIESSIHRRVRSEIRCRHCCNLSKLVDDRDRTFNKPFVIQTGDYEGRAYELQAIPIGKSALLDCQKNGRVIEISLSPFYHYVFVGFILEDLSSADLGNEVVAAYQCRGTGVLLLRVPANHAVDIRIEKSLHWFLNYLWKLYNADLVHYNPGIGFNSRSDWLQVYVINLDAIEITCKDIRLTTGNKPLVIRQGHPQDVENFNGSERIWFLFDHKNLDLDVAKVVTGYYLITLLLLHGRWLNITTSRFDLKSLYGDKGLETLENVSKNPTNVRLVLNHTYMGKTKLETFLTGKNLI